MEKGQGHSYLQLTFTFLQVALSFQVLDGTQDSNPTPMLPPPALPDHPVEAMLFCSALPLSALC